MEREILTFKQIEGFTPLDPWAEPQSIDELVNAIVDSAGYNLCPILVWEDNIICGYDKFVALQTIHQSGINVKDWVVAANVTDIVNHKLLEYESEEGYIPDLDFDNVGWLFKDTWVESFKDDIKEWGI